MRLAAIDCGTNTVRLLISDVKDGGATSLLRYSEVVRLGQGVDATGRVSDAALFRARATLGRYADALREYDVSSVRMVATSALRDAENGELFARLATELIGVEPEVITGKAEADLSFGGAVAGLTGGPFLVVDIGGGSTEIIAGDEHNQVAAAVSLDIGAVRLTERVLGDVPPTPSQVTTAHELIGDHLRQAAPVFALPTAELVGVAGTVLTLAALDLGLTSYDPDRVHGHVIPVDRVRAFADELLSADAAARQRYHVVEPGRRDIIAAGALILAEVMAVSGAAAVRASEHDILDGTIMSMLPHVG